MIKLIQGDCLDKMNEIQSNSVDLVFTSPPYNLGISTGGGIKGGGKSGKWKKGANNLGKGYKSYDDAMKYSDYIKWQKEVLRSCWRLLKNDGAIYYNHKPRVQAGTLQTPLSLIPEELEGNIRQIIIWKRSGGFNFSPTFYLPTHEWIILIAKKNFRLKDIRSSGAKDVWEVTQENNSEHPAPFPVALPEIAISTTKSEIVFDPFMGSGTTGVAACNLNRSFIGIELDSEYFKTAANRIKAAEAQLNF